jgi:hypothetical protein
MRESIEATKMPLSASACHDPERVDREWLASERWPFE